MVGAGGLFIGGILLLGAKIGTRSVAVPTIATATASVIASTTSASSVPSTGFTYS